MVPRSGVTVEEALLALLAGVAIVLLFLGLADALEGDVRARLRARRRALARRPPLPRGAPEPPRAERSALARRPTAGRRAAVPGRRPRMARSRRRPDARSGVGRGSGGGGVGARRPRRTPRERGLPARGVLHRHRARALAPAPRAAARGGRRGVAWWRARDDASPSRLGARGGPALGGEGPGGPATLARPHSPGPPAVARRGVRRRRRGALQGPRGARPRRPAARPGSGSAGPHPRGPGGAAPRADPSAPGRRGPARRARAGAAARGPGRTGARGGRLRGGPGGRGSPGSSAPGAHRAHAGALTDVGPGVPRDRSSD